MYLWFRMEIITRLKIQGNRSFWNSTSTVKSPAFQVFVKKNCHIIITIFICPRRCVDIWHRGSPGGPRLTRRRPPGRDWAPRPALRWRRWWRGPRPPSLPSPQWSRSCTRFRSDCTDRERRVHLTSPWLSSTDLSERSTLWIGGVGPLRGVPTSLYSWER